MTVVTAPAVVNPAKTSPDVGFVSEIFPGPAFQDTARPLLVSVEAVRIVQPIWSEPMFVWRGWGIVVVLITFLCSLAAELITRGLAGRGYWETHSYPLAMALLGAAAVIWWTDARLYARQETRTLVDEKTGERLNFAPRHELFFIRMKWWSLVCAGGGIAVLLMNWAPGAK
jgi:hypothetical protein